MFTEILFKSTGYMTTTSLRNLHNIVDYSREMGRGSYAHIPQHHAFTNDGQGFKHCSSPSRISTASGERSKNCSRNKFTECGTGIVFPSFSIDQRVPHFLGETYRVCNDRVT